MQRVAVRLRRAYDMTKATVRGRVDAAGDGAGPRSTDGVADAGGLPALAPGASNQVEVVRVPVPHPSVSSRDDSEVPKELRIAAAYSWRLIVLAVAAAGVLYVVGRLYHVVVPLAISLLLSALLSPAVKFLRRRAKLPPSLAAGLVLVTGLAAVFGTLTLVITQFVDNFDELSVNASAGIREIRNWLQREPLNLSNDQLNAAIDTATQWINSNQGKLTGWSLTTVTATIETLAAFFLVLFATFFFIRDGDRIWRFLVRIFPGQAEPQVEAAGFAAWGTLVSYVRATVLVAFIDALGIGIGLYFLDVPLAFPLAALVFLGAFVPIVGSTVSGSVAVLVALVTQGPLDALIALIIVIAVQQLEGHVLQPLIMGRAVAIHPLAVIVAIAAGVVLAGIIGALVAVPIVAVVNTAVRYLVLKRRDPEGVIISAS
jgi:putative heme transporter